MSEGKQNLGQLNLPGSSRRYSRDEMNLAEFPLTVLSTRANPTLKTLEFKDSVKGRNGEVLERRWLITGADKFGLPTASDDEVLLGLLKLTVDDGMRDPKIFFTRYELLKTLHWTTEGRSYTRLQKALDRLSGVRIKASNAFFDNETKVHSTRNFGVIDAYEINSGSDALAQTSYFMWSETLFKSFQVGFIKKLDLEFYLELQSAVSKRLYRYLDKHFWYKSRVTIDLFTLAHEKIGISRTYQYASSIRQILDPAIEELMKAGFLSSFEYVGKGRSTDVVLNSGKQRVKLNLDQEGGKKAIEVLTNEEGNSLRDEVIQALVTRGLKEQQVIRLVGARSDETLKRVSQIVSYFDYLIASNSRLVSRSPVGFLYRAVENPEQFVLPGESAKKYKQEALDVLVLPSRAAEASKSSVMKESLEPQYLIARKQAIRQFKEGMDTPELGSMAAEVERALQKVKGLISPARFDEAVTHGVEEKIASRCGFPIFEEWLKKK